MNYKSNCYGYIYAGLRDSEDDFFKDIDDLGLRDSELFGKVDEEIVLASQEIMEVFDNGESDIEYKLKVLQLFDANMTSQHVAFIDNFGKFYDQNGPDGEIRWGGNLDDLLFQYKKLFGTAYFQVHPLIHPQESLAYKFLKL